MKLTKTKLKQIIKEELTFLGALETELNFARKHGLLENEDEDDTYEEEYYGSRTWEQDLEDREKRWEAEERRHDEEEFDDIAFSETVSTAVNELGGERVLEIVNGVIATLEV